MYKNPSNTLLPQHPATLPPLLSGGEAQRGRIHGKRGRPGATVGGKGDGRGRAGLAMARGGEQDIPRLLDENFTGLFLLLF